MHMCTVSIDRYAGIRDPIKVKFHQPFAMFVALIVTAHHDVVVIVVLIVVVVIVVVVVVVPRSRCSSSAKHTTHIRYM